MCVLAAPLMVGAQVVVTATEVHVMTDATWRATNPKPPVGWNTDVGFDDSDAAGWQFAVKDTKDNNHIWFESIQSADGPANAWFRKVFTLDQPASGASGTFWLDDNGQVYINGQEIINDSGTGASTFNLTLDPALFVVGDNLIAIHGVDISTPYHTVGVDMTVTVPEPAGLSVIGIAALLVGRRRWQVC
jgi:hypothetical protein